MGRRERYFSSSQESQGVLLFLFNLLFPLLLWLFGNTEELIQDKYTEPNTKNEWHFSLLRTHTAKCNQNLCGTLEKYLL